MTSRKYNFRKRIKKVTTYTVTQISFSNLVVNEYYESRDTLGHRYLKNAAIFMTSEMQNGRSRLSKEVIFTLLAYDE